VFGTGEVRADGLPNLGGYGTVVALGDGAELGGHGCGHGGDDADRRVVRGWGCDRHGHNVAHRVDGQHRFVASGSRRPAIRCVPGAVRCAGTIVAMTDQREPLPVRQEDVPADVPQRSATATGTAEPIETRPGSLWPTRQEDVPPDVPQRSATATGTAEIVPVPGQAHD
jgi:hypothetical protein